MRLFLKCVIIKKTSFEVFFMGRVMGFEPTNIGTTIRGLNHLATPAIYILLNCQFLFCGSASEPVISQAE